MYGDLNLNNHKITNLANPVTESDSVNKGFLDNAISNIVHFAESSEFGSRLATLGINNDDQYVVIALSNSNSEVSNIWCGSTWSSTKQGLSYRKYST